MLGWEGYPVTCPYFIEYLKTLGVSQGYKLLTRQSGQVRSTKFPLRRVHDPCPPVIPLQVIYLPSC